MPWSDFLFVFQWWGTLFLVGAAAYPITRRLFHGWHDNGYLFTKAVGMAIVPFLVYLGAMLHVVPFTQGAVWGAIGMVFVTGVILQKRARNFDEFRKKSIADTFIDRRAVFLCGSHIVVLGESA